MCLSLMLSTLDNGIEQLIQSTHENRIAFDEEDSYWSHYSEGSLMAFLQMSRVIKEASTQAPFYARTVTNAFVAGIHVSCRSDRQEFKVTEAEAGLNSSRRNTSTLRFRSTLIG
jgi:hypothetical protein